MISQKSNNLIYAPGLASYGVKGLKGEDGKAGNKVFYTDLTTTTALLNKVKTNKEPLTNSDKPLTDYTYQAGDIFITKDGKQYVLKSLSASTATNMFHPAVTGVTLENPSNILYYDIYTAGQNRVSANSNKGLEGVDIINSVSNDINSQAAMNIVSEDIQDDKINFLLMSNIDRETVSSGQFTTYYNVPDRSYHIGGHEKYLMDMQTVIKVPTNGTIYSTDTHSSVLGAKDFIVRAKNLIENHVTYKLFDKNIYGVSARPTTDADVRMFETDDHYLQLLFHDCNNLQIKEIYKSLFNNMMVKIYLTDTNYIYTLADDAGLSSMLAENKENQSYHDNIIKFNIPLSTYIQDISLVINVSIILNNEIFLRKPNFVYMSNENGQSFKIAITQYGSPNILNITYRYSGDTVWHNYTPSTYLTVPANLTIYLRNTTETFSKDIDNYYSFAFTPVSSDDQLKIYLGGELTALLNYNSSITEIPNNAFRKMFYQCNSIVSAEDLTVTADIYGASAFYESFFLASYLKYPPLFLITTAQLSCFYCCFAAGTSSDDKKTSSLLYAPNLLATTVSKQAYSCMFSYCTNLLKGSTIIDASILLGENQFEYMFRGCTNMVTGPQSLNVLILAPECYYAMFIGCSSLKIAPIIQATVVNNACQNCFAFMFLDCKSLQSMTVLVRSLDFFNGTSYTDHWVTNVPETCIYYYNPTKGYNITKASDSTVPNLQNVKPYYIS